MGDKAKTLLNVRSSIGEFSIAGTLFAINNIAIEKNEEYGEAYTRRGMAKMSYRGYSKEDACADFELGEEFDDPLASDYIKEYCK